MVKLEFTPVEIDNYADAVARLHRNEFSYLFDRDPNLPDQNTGVGLENAAAQFRPLPGIMHTFYRMSVWHAGTLRVHADGIFPGKLIKDRRPNEPEVVFDYRYQIYEAKTKPTFNKVLTALQKIRRSSDWSILWANKNEFSRIADEETLEHYTCHEFPYFGELTNWIFTAMLRKYLVDPNAVVYIQPLDLVKADNEYYKPFPTVFNSEDVIDYAEGNYCVLNIPEGCNYYVRNTAHTGYSFYVVTTQQIFRYDQSNGKGDYVDSPGYPFTHGLGVLPAFKLKGILVDQAGDEFMYESKVAGMLPELNEAVREYSDLQAAKVLNIYPERWQYSNVNCPHCKGNGFLHNPSWTENCNCPETVQCEDCKGLGVVVNAGPFGKMIVRPSSTLEGQTPAPTPPAGYIQKDVATVKYQDESVEQHLYNALAAINFQFMADTPLTQAGVAKAVDRDESNNFTHGVAEDIVAAMDSCMKIIALYRYGALYPADDIEDDMLPKIAVPENFDILYIATAEKELADAKTNKVNPVILNAMEIEYCSKRFSLVPDVRDRLVLVLKLDPLPNISDDAKLGMLASKGVTQETYVISSNIQEFVQRALDEDDKFADKNLKDQKAVMKKYAKEQIDANTAAARVIPISAVGQERVVVKDDAALGAGNAAAPPAVGAQPGQQSQLTGTNQDGSLHGNSLVIRPVAAK